MTSSGEDVPQKKLVVQKYGGSSLATLEKLQAVAGKIYGVHRQGHEIVVVVSAMGKTTNELLALAREIGSSPCERELDVLLSTGEQVSTALLCMALHNLGAEAVSLSGSQAGIVTTDNHQDADIIEIRPFRVRDELARGKIVVVAGFQGESYRGELTTLGRGGSDTTAVALAAALGAAHCDIYSDVDGVYSADPRVIESSTRLDRLGYEEMQELARQGARVLNAEAVEFARQRRIAIFARSTFGGPEHTVIERSDGNLEDGLRQLRAHGVAGVAGRRDLVHLEYAAPPGSPSKVGPLLEACSGADVQAASLGSAGRRLEALIATENVADPAAFCDRLRDVAGPGLRLTEKLGSASAVGLNVGSRAPVLARAHEHLDALGIEPLAHFTSRESVTCVVKTDEVDLAMQALHDAFVAVEEEDDDEAADASGQTDTPTSSSRPIPTPA